jgi:hypothetical protein
VKTSVVTASESKEPDDGGHADPLKGILDRFFYAPLGAVSSTGDELDEKAQRGRQQFELQVRNARFLGEMVVSYGSKEVERRLRDLLPGQRPATQDHRPSPPAAEEPKAPPAASGGDLDRLIPDYDALSASQVVKMLEGLSQGDLEAVAEYESSHRRRTTILHRISQLSTTP